MAAQNTLGSDFCAGTGTVHTARRVAFGGQCSLNAGVLMLGISGTSVAAKRPMSPPDFELLSVFAKPFFHLAEHFAYAFVDRSRNANENLGLGSEQYPDR